MEGLFTIVPMREEHLCALTELERLCFSQPWSCQGLAAELENPSARFYTALSPEGEVAGYVGMHLVLDEGYLANLAVFPQFRGQGAARALLAALQGLEKEVPLAFISLEVRESNLPAIRLYERMGFQPVGVRKNFYTLPDENALIMTWNSKGETT